MENYNDGDFLDSAGESYSHPEYITGFPMGIECILHYLLEGYGKLSDEQYKEGRYLILKYKDQIDENFQKIMMESNLSDRLFEGIKDIENYKRFM